MSKGSGTSKKSASAGNGPGKKSLQQIVNGAGGVVASDYLRTGMRDHSLQYARQAYAGGGNPTVIASTLSEPIKLHVQYEGRHGVRVLLNDGRHRMTAAKEAGATHIKAIIREFGPRGGERRRWVGVVKL